MELTNELIEFCESQKWDNDIRQDVYDKLLHLDDKYLLIEDVKSYASTIYKHCVYTAFEKARRRLELLDEHDGQVRTNLGYAKSNSSDPADILVGTADMEAKLKDLSPLLRATLEGVVRGENPEEQAAKEGVNVNVIYKRIQRIKEVLGE